ncbi:MAG: COP23 domain-containing protein [Pleurocapsa sp. MO_226.B13]|nr:COP23 domain-containing protein [Pleurocapsa sp. MO_226.B13]
MNRKNIYTIALLGCAIALSTSPLRAEENSQAKAAESIFVCATQQDAPTMYAYTPGEINLTPLMTWHAEYLLPEQSGAEICQETATKLQASIEQQERKYLKTDTPKETNSVCLVTEEDGTCTSEASEQLFSVNPNYNAGCVLENKKPIECMALNVRGVYSFEDKPYQPLWWPW